MYKDLYQPKTEIRRRVLTKLEGESNLTLQSIAEDYQRFVSVKKDSKDIKESGIAHLRKIHQKSHFNPLSKTSQTKKKDYFHPHSPQKQVNPIKNKKIYCLAPVRIVEPYQVHIVFYDCGDSVSCWWKKVCQFFLLNLIRSHL